MDKDVLFSDLKNRMDNGLQTDEQFDDFYDVIDDLLELDLDKKEKKQLSRLECEVEIQQMNMKLANTPEEDYKNQMYYRGKLISLYKKREKLSIDKNEKMTNRSLYLDLLKEHKEVIAKYKNSKNSKIPIGRKLGLTIKDISTSIKLFMGEKDILQKVKNIIRDTAIGVTSAAALSLIISVAIAYITKTPISLSLIVGAAPTVAYIGLNSLIRNVFSETEFQRFRYQQSDEYKALVNAFYESHKEEFESIGRLNEARANVANREDKIIVNDEIINKYNKLVEEATISGIKSNYELQALGLLRENKRIREQIKDDYEEELNDDKEKYVQNNRELTKLNIKIFAKENSIKEAMKFASKNFLRSANFLLITKAILSGIAPSVFAIDSFSDISMPLLISAINGIIDIPTYGNKLKYKESEADKEEEQNKKNRIREILGSDDRAISMA